MSRLAVLATSAFAVLAVAGCSSDDRMARADWERSVVAAREAIDAGETPSDEVMADVCAGVADYPDVLAVPEVQRVIDERC